MAIKNVLDLAARQASWLLSRENLVAQNVANANTPGYKTADLTPFEASLQTASLQLTTTSPRHISIPPKRVPNYARRDHHIKGRYFLVGQ